MLDGWNMKSSARDILFDFQLCGLRASHDLELLGLVRVLTYCQGIVLERR